MEPSDAKLLNEMRETIDAYRFGTLDVGELADQLHTLSDSLRFRDHPWEHELTQQMVTLDSASTFTPKDDEQASQVSHAIGTAIDALLRLIEDKLA